MILQYYTEVRFTLERLRKYILETSVTVLIFEAKVLDIIWQEALLTTDL
jgi:hypothetical protein